MILMARDDFSMPQLSINNVLTTKQPNHITRKADLAFSTKEMGQIKKWLGKECKHKTQLSVTKPRNGFINQNRI